VLLSQVREPLVKRTWESGGAAAGGEEPPSALFCMLAALAGPRARSAISTGREPSRRRLCGVETRCRQGSKTVGRAGAARSGLIAHNAPRGSSQRSSSFGRCLSPEEGGLSLRPRLVRAVLCRGRGLRGYGSWRSCSPARRQEPDDQDEAGHRHGDRAYDPPTGSGPRGSTRGRAGSMGFVAGPSGGPVRPVVSAIR
jgi:hypothetical protein